MSSKVKKIISVNFIKIGLQTRKLTLLFFGKRGGGGGSKRNIAESGEKNRKPKNVLKNWVYVPAPRRG